MKITTPSGSIIECTTEEYEKIRETLIYPTPDHERRATPTPIPHTRTCDGCQTTFNPGSRGQRYCTLQCRQTRWEKQKEQWRIQRANRKLTCRNCKKEFNVTSKYKAYCDYACRDEYYKKKWHEEHPPKYRRTMRAIREQIEAAITPQIIPQNPQEQKLIPYTIDELRIARDHGMGQEARTNYKKWQSEQRRQDKLNLKTEMRKIKNFQIRKHRQRKTRTPKYTPDQYAEIIKLRDEQQLDYSTIREIMNVTNQEARHIYQNAKKTKQK